ncbi:restriction endonuclease subunit S [Streptosporangium saharense]|nr:restriction endonuclease subunit S [Streptosporangium saharense]
MRLRYVAQINPSCPAFDGLHDEAELTFLPMENVWPGDRLDLGQRRTKSSVATGYTRFQNGDVLVPKITPTFEASRSVWVADGLVNGTGAGTTELHVLRPGAEIDPRFLLCITHSHPFLKLGEAEMYGVAGQKRVPDEFIRNFAVEVPPLEDQRRIADFLDAEVAQIARIELVQRAALSKIDERDRAFLDFELDRLFARFGAIPFRRVIRRIEQGSSPQCDSTPAEDGEWGVLKISSVKRGTFFPKENKRLPESVIPVRRYAVRDGDLLITRANTPELVGDVAVVDQSPRMLLLPDLIYRVELWGGLLPEFSSIVLRGSRVRGLIQATARGTSQSMVKLRGEDIREWPIPNVDLAEQRKVIKRVAVQQAVTSSLRFRIGRQLELLAERKQALITAAVTGRIDVTTMRGIRE